MRCQEKDQTSCNDADNSGCVCPVGGSFADEADCTAAQTAAEAAAPGASMFGGKGWTCTTGANKATCATGRKDSNKNKVAAAGDCKAIAAPGTLPASANYDDCSTITRRDVPGTTWANTGCPKKADSAVVTVGDEGGADGSHYCSHYCSHYSSSLKCLL